MKPNPNLSGYDQSDILALLSSGSIVPNIDDNGNLFIQNSKDKLFKSAITIQLKNMVYISTKVETKIDPTFYEL
jgi:hypothetical protein